MIRHSLSKELLAETVKAVEALRIKHFQKLKSALDRREELLLELFGMSGYSVLPEEIDSALVPPEVRKYKKNHAETFKQMDEFEERLLQLFQKQLNDFKETGNHLKKGKNWLSSSRNYVSSSNGSRFDRCG